MPPFEEIESLVGRPVPAELAALLERYPSELTAFAAKLGFAPREQFLYPDAKTLLWANQMVREEDIWTEEGPWPKGFLDIGCDIGGDHFALALTEAPPRVHRLHHDTGKFHLLVPSLDAYVAGLLRLARAEVKSLKTAFEQSSE